MRLVVAHNFYQQPGGEDQAFETEAALLESQGHAVTRYIVHNNDTQAMGSFALAGASIWHRASARELRGIFRAGKIEIAHFHNTLPLISPSAYYAARAEGVAVVQTLHNYRLMCPGALFLRDQKICEACVGKPFPWPGVRHACYRGSTTASGAVAAMLAVHRALGTWQQLVNVYVALTEFAKTKFLDAGLPAGRVVVKPNLVGPDPGVGSGGGGYALFVGRLSAEKGIRTLIRAWSHLPARIHLKVAGDGPLAEELRETAKDDSRVEWLGRLPRSAIFELMHRADALIVPSEWYEGFPIVIAEAFAKGLPVIASEIGALPSIAEHGHTGLTFKPGDWDDLGAKAAWLFDRPHVLARMRRVARAEFLAKYTAEQNYATLMDIYRRAVRSN